MHFVEEVNGQNISYYEYYPDLKPVILLIHGNLSAKNCWQQTIDGLGQNLARIIAIDLRGYGDSSYNKPLTSLNSLAEDLKVFCEKKQLYEITVVGWSLGGLVAMKLAELLPQRVRKIVLTCSVGHLGISQNSPTGEPINTLEKIKQHQRFQFLDKVIKDKNTLLMRGIFEASLLKYAQHLSEERKKELGSSAFQQRHYFESLAIVANPDINLDKIKAKWLIIIGKEDTITPLTCIEPTIKLLQKAQQQVSVTIIENAGHMIPLEHTEQYVGILRDFVSK